MTIVLACGHSKASPAAPTPTSTDQPTDTTDQPTNAGQPAADERQIHPVDARVISLAHGQGKLEFVVGFPKGTDPELIHTDWIGMFTADGKEIPGSKFKLKTAERRMARAEIVADALPSETVRLFPPGYRGRF
jgi:hypothetical protein